MSFIHSEQYPALFNFGCMRSPHGCASIRWAEVLLPCDRYIGLQVNWRRGEWPTLHCMSGQIDTTWPMINSTDHREAILIAVAVCLIWIAAGLASISALIR